MESTNEDDASPSGASDTQGRMSPQMQTVAGQAKDAAKEVAAGTMAAAGDLASTTRDKLETAVSASKDDAASTIDHVAAALKGSADHLSGQHAWIAQIAEKGAQELGSLAESLRSNDLQGLLGALQGLAKRQPAIFAGAAIAAGFAAVRVGRVAVAGATKSDLPSMPELT